ncbi:MAG: hypothetical protein EP336_07255 [Rhodobacteraceae bacterium]|uniref:hypothetical protein n=1 Tax=Celeribacter ethanolicus TaxID=1758178 RepID=UPI0012FD2AB5|nr:hypothetical protein [Celeribacter ethanolicus]TNE67324.1 MAG: hypothetical protein EP336_07255 [Paracoccaceae bacterium]
MSPTQTVASAMSHDHTDCCPCPGMNTAGAAGHLFCAHAACLLCAVSGTEPPSLSRTIYAAGFPSPTIAGFLPYAPALDLPPPRPGSTFV